MRLDVKNLADTTVVVTAPDLGDEIQTLKAGIMEIGDIFVVNKSDKENADRTMQEIYSMIMMTEVTGWRPRVLKTNALSGEGVTSLVEAIRQHRKYHKEKSTADELDRLSREVTYAAKRYVEDIALERTISTKWFNDLLIQVKRREIDPYTAARKLLKRALRS